MGKILLVLIFPFFPLRSPAILQLPFCSLPPCGVHVCALCSLYLRQCNSVL